MSLVFAGVGVIADVGASLLIVFKPIQVLFKVSRLGKIAVRAGELAAGSLSSRPSIA